MFRMSHDAVDFFSADFTAAGVIVAGEEYPLGYFAAEALEVSRQTIGSLENGRYNPSILLAFKLARYFGTTIEDIFIYEEDGT